MSWTYNGYEGNDYQETPWYDREKALFQAIIDALPDAGETYVDSQHYHSKLVSPDGTVDPVLCVTDDGFLGVGTSTPGYLVHVWVGDGGPAAGAAVGAENLIMESDGDAGISVLLGSGGTATLYTGDADDLDGKITWNDNQWKFYSDVSGSVYNCLMSLSYSGYFNPGLANMDFVVAHDTGIAFHIDGGTGNTIINYSSTDSDLTVNWDTGVALFCQGSDGFIGIYHNAPEYLVHIKIADVLATAPVGADEFAIEGGNVGMSLLGSQNCAGRYYANMDTSDGELKFTSFDVAGAGMKAELIAESWAGITVYNGPSGTETVMNEAANAAGDTRIEGGTDTHLGFFDAGADKACISTDTPLAAKLTVVQDDDSGESCVSLKQDDVSEGCIDFVASDRGAILTTCYDSVASVRCELNGTVYRVALFADA